MNKINVNIVVMKSAFKAIVVVLLLLNTVDISALKTVNVVPFEILLQFWWQ